MTTPLHSTVDSIRDVVSRTLDDPRKSALIGAATGALKGAAVGVVAGKIVAFTVVGAATGAAFAAVLSGIARTRTTAVPPALPFKA